MPLQQLGLRLRTWRRKQRAGRSQLLKLYGLAAWLLRHHGSGGNTQDSGQGPAKESPAS